MTIKRFPFGLTIAVLIAFSLLVGLGVWQLQRLKWKEGVLARREAAMTAAPTALVPALAGGRDLEALDGLRVEVDCPGLAQAPYESLYGLAEGQMVTRLVSPCHLTGAPYEAILVDRGYVLQTVPSRPAVIADDATPFKVTGFLISPIKELRIPTREVDFDAPLPKVAPGSKLWMNRDLPGMAAVMGIKDPAPYFLAAQNSTNPDWTDLHPGLPPAIIPNNHLQYALTWFALAGVLAAIYAAMLKKRLKA